MEAVSKGWTDERLDGFRVSVEGRFDRVDERFDRVDERFDRVDERFDLIGRRFDAIDQRFGEHDARLERIDQSISALARGQIAMTTVLAAGFVGTATAVVATSV
ncbi:MAG TPA: hypothetical protein VIT85_02280 [Solirubrobacterales bacterium]